MADESQEGAYVIHARIAVVCGAYRRTARTYVCTTHDAALFSSVLLFVSRLLTNYSYIYSYQEGIQKHISALCWMGCLVCFAQLSAL